MPKIHINVAFQKKISDGELWFVETGDAKVRKSKYPDLDVIKYSSIDQNEEIIQKLKQEKRIFYTYKLFDSYLRDASEENEIFNFTRTLKGLIAEGILKSASASANEMSRQSLIGSMLDASIYKPIAPELIERVGEGFFEYVKDKKQEIINIGHHIPVEMNESGIHSEDYLLDIDEQEMFREFSKKSDKSPLNLKDQSACRLKKIKYLTILVKAKQAEREIVDRQKGKELKMLHDVIDSIGKKMKEYTENKFKEKNELNRLDLDMKETLFSDLATRREELDIKLKSEMYNEAEINTLKLIREKINQSRKEVENRKRTAYLLLENCAKEDKEFLEYVANIKKIQKEIDQKKSFLAQLV